MFTASEVESGSLAMGINPAFAGLLGGMSGGVAQAYATMGKCVANILYFDQVSSRFYDLHEDG